MIATLGFVAFASGIPRSETKIAEAADGIVVLTGGASRVVDAVELLASRHGKRLLISGVNPSTTTGELTRVNPEFERLFECCIDLGHEATNTIGNAVETGRWAREQKFRSLIVVTSGWHMPRALIEIENELPEARLIPYPVVSERMREDPWWSDGPTVRLLLIEYVKYVASFVRVRLDPARFAGSSRRTHS
jgi:uncharacterized SAM-binding protein YcdF (DUF218 family)